MCNKAIVENGGTLESIPCCYKNQKLYNQAVDNYVHGLEFVPECYKTEEMCDKAVNRCFLYLILFPIDITPKKCVRVVSEDAYMLVYCLSG